MALFLLGLALGGAAGAGLARWFQERRRRDLGRYLAFGAHELNGPLTALTMTLSNVTSGIFGEVPAALQPWMAMSREQVARLAALTGQLRDFVHLELSGDYEGLLEPQPAEEVVAAAAQAVQGGYAQSAIPLAVDCPRGLPAVPADPERTVRELTGLLYHARKLRLSGPVNLSARVNGDHVEFVVEFEGPRLDAAETLRSLDLYYPGRRSPALRTAGFGLGLSRAVLRKHGWGLALEVQGARHRIVMRAARARK